MKYESDLIREIVTSPSGRRALDYTSPIYQNARIALWLFQAIGLEFDSLRRRTEELTYQIFPQTATWGLDYWEELYALTSDKDTSDALDEESLKARRAALMVKILKRSPMNPARIELILESLTGAPAILKERTAKNTFSITFTKPQYKLGAVRSFLDNCKPAHLIYSVRTDVEYALHSHLGLALAVQSGISYNIDTMWPSRQNADISTAISTSIKTKVVYDIEVSL